MGSADPVTMHIEHALAAAQKNLMAGRLDDAASLLHGILASVPDHSEALSGLGYIAAAQGDHARAAEFLIQASAHMSVSFEQLNFAAQGCQLAQRHDDAIALVERCLARFPDHAASLHGVAMGLIQLGELQRALEILVHLCKIQPQSAEAHYNRGSLLGKLERYEDELDAYRQAIALTPRFVRAYVNLGVAMRDLR